METLNDGSTIMTKPNGTRDLTIAKGVQTIENWAFALNKLTSVSIANGVETIGDGAFESNQLKEIVIGNSVQTIGYGAFASNQLTQVILPKALYEKRGKAFANFPARYLKQLRNKTGNKGLKFYEYDAKKPDTKGRYLGRQD